MITAEMAQRLLDSAKRSVFHTEVDSNGKRCAIVLELQRRVFIHKIKGKQRTKPNKTETKTCQEDKSHEVMFENT